MQYLGTTKAAIDFLNKVKKGKYVKPVGKVNEWLEKYLDPEDINIIRKEREKNGKFLLIKYPSVLARPIPRTSLRFVTTLCTAIGVLGTFYGIQQGLQGIDLSTQDTKQLMTASTELLAGMKTAFSTSLMGLGSGSLFTLVLFGSDLLRQKRRKSLRQKLQNITTLKTAEDNNLEVSKALNLVAQNLTGFKHLKAEDIGQAVGRSIAEQFAGLNHLSASAIGESVKQQIFPLLKEIFNEQKKIRELQENQGQRVLELLINDLRIQVLEPIADRLDRSAELTQQASTAVLNLHQKLGGISQSLANSILTIQNFQQETLVQLQEFAHNLGDSVNEFKTDTRGVLQQTSQEDDLTRFREEYQRNLQIFFQEQNTLLEGTLGKQQEGLSGVVKHLDQVFRDECQRRSELTQAVDASMTKIQESVAQINKLVIAAGLNDGQRLIQLENLARGIGEQLEKVDNSYSNLNQKFDNSLHAWQSHLEGSMQRTVDLQVNFFQQADTSMARVCGNLLKTAEVLVAALPMES
nr:hypothetical protein [Nodularia sp. LEGE 04288]